MAEKFLKPPGITKRLSEFKDTWYGIAKKTEELSKHKSGFNDEFKNALKDILSDLKRCKNKLETITPSIKHNQPTTSTEIDKKTAAVTSAINEFSTTIEKDIENIINLKKLKKRSADIQKAIEKMEIEYRNVESRTLELCTKYFERKKEYKREHDIIEEKINAKIAVIKKEFYKKIKPIVEEYGITIKSEEIEIDQLFDLILQDPYSIENISLIQKETKKGLLESIFKKKEDTDKGAKETVLKYVSKEIAGDARPIKALKTQALVKLDSKFADLKALERACKDAEKKREEIVVPRQKLLNELSAIRKNDIFSYEDHNKIFSIRETYLKIFNEKNPIIKEYRSFITRLFEDYEYEPDIEKRELKTLIKTLKSTIKTLEEENKKIKKLKKENTDLQKKLDKIKTVSKKTIVKQEIENARLKEKLENISKEYAKHKKDLESKIHELINEKNAINKELDKQKQKNKTLLTENHDQTARLKALEKQYNALKTTKEELDEKLKQTTNRIKRFEKYMKLALNEGNK